MARHAALTIACVSVFAAGIQAAASQGSALETGDSIVREFAGDQELQFVLRGSSPVLVEVSNLGRDSVLTVSDDSGQRVLRSAGWRGPEHYYIALLEPDGEMQLTIVPDDPISPPGEIRIDVSDAAQDVQRLRAEQAMTTAADLNLAWYYGESNERDMALEKYREAAGLFAAAGHRSRQADALFEAANVSDVMCRRELTRQLFTQARETWSGIDDIAGVAAAENMLGQVDWAGGSGATARALFESAAKTREQLGNDYHYAEAINNLGLVHNSRGDPTLAEQYFLEALEIWQGEVDFVADDVDLAAWSRLPDPPFLRHSLTALNNLALVNDTVGETDEAERLWLRALEMTGSLDDEFNAATIQSNLGNLKRRTGDMAEAMRLLDATLEYFSEVSPDEFWASQVNFNIGLVYRDLGDLSRAREFFNRSLELRSADCDPLGRVETLRELAELEVDAGDVSNALQLTAAGRDLLRPLPGNSGTEAQLFELEGRAQMISGNNEAAVERFDEAVRLYRSAGDRFGELTARTARAGANEALGRHFAAIAELRTALEIATQLDSRLEEFRVLTTLGSVYLSDGKPVDAIEQATRALELSESVRERTITPALLRDFSNVQRTAYDIVVQAHLALGEPEVAWAIFDNGRAQGFSDLVHRGDLDLSLLNAAQQQRYVYLAGTVARRAEARTELLARDDQRAADLALRELLPLMDEMEALQATARRAGPATNSPATLESLQSLLGESDLVLEYFVSESVAGVWSISDVAIAFTEIPPGDELADRVGAFLERIRQRRTAGWNGSAELASALLPASAFETVRPSSLIIVPDGPLHYLPFGALPDPRSDGNDILITTQTVRYLPSFRAAAELAAGSSGEAEGIAVLADPIFQADDPRVRRPQDSLPAEIQLSYLDQSLMRSSTRVGLSNLPRLPSTRAEAAAIVDAAGDIPVLSLHGAEASRETVLSGRLQPYRILHFATHGILDETEPALSGIVLSGVTDDGVKQSSFLRSQDIAGLDLAAELVVLSACETGLGRHVRGEGLLGLSRAFFYAGATQVVSTLWQVPDTATAELMGRFYNALLRDGTSTAEALRLAQLGIQQDPRWSDPYYWAPFILQGADLALAEHDDQQDKQASTAAH